MRKVEYSIIIHHSNITPVMELISQYLISWKINVGITHVDGNYRITLDCISDTELREMAMQLIEEINTLDCEI